MTDFTREMPQYRYASIHYGDDIQRVASRELGSANRWPELAWLNDLRAPYITDDPQRAGDGVLLSGGFVKVPAPAATSPRSTDDGQIFERDCLMVNRQLQITAGGDLAVVSGASNLSQQLRHRINTPRGQARRNPEYGCLVHRLIGKVGGPAASLLGAEYVKAALLADYRVSRVTSSVASVQGDVVRVQAGVVAIDGGAVEDIAIPMPAPERPAAPPVGAMHLAGYGALGLDGSILAFTND